MDSARITKLMKQINENSHDESAYLALASEYLKIGRWMEAAAAFRRAAELNPDCYEAWQGMGEAYVHAGVDKEAASAYKHAIHVANYLGIPKAAEYSQSRLSQLPDAA